MYSLRAGLEPAMARVAVAASARPALSAMAVLAAALMSSGCSSRPDGTTSFIWSEPARQPYHVAAAPPRPVDLEDDGREAQAPPPRRIRQEPDDPTEPYSRNYGAAPSRRADAAPRAGVPDAGSATVAKAGAAPASDPARIPEDLPPGFRRRLAAAGDE